MAPTDIPEDIVNWSKEQIKAAGLPLKSRAPVHSGDFTPFDLGHRTRVRIRIGREVTWIGLAFSRDKHHYGVGYSTGLDNGESQGQLICESWEKLRTSESVSVTAINNTLYLIFGGPHGEMVGSYIGSWGSAEVFSSNDGVFYFLTKNHSDSQGSNDPSKSSRNDSESG